MTEQSTPKELGGRPDVVIVLADDMGYSDIGCFGGEVDTPHLDELAREGVRLTQFYNTARCSPSRASLLTGLHPHQAGVAILTGDQTPEGYPGNLNNECVTVGEVLGSQGYATYLSGKWHVAADVHTPNSSWPTRRGFDSFYGILQGAVSYFDPGTLTRNEQNIENEAQDPGFYFTDAISDSAADFVRRHHEIRADDPMLLYVAYTAPHWPLQAPEADIEHYRGRFDRGWDELRAERARRLIDLGILDDQWPMSDRDPEVAAWDGVGEKDWEARRMEVYAAQVQRMDSGIGRVVDALRETGRLDNTLMIFLSDNGGCAEDFPDAAAASVGLREYSRASTRDGVPVRFGNTADVVPGGEDTYTSYGRAWANLSNTPFREYKHWVHEGGISTPLIAHWPVGIGARGAIVHHAHQLPDILATVLEATGAPYPNEFDGRTILPLEGMSMLASLRGYEPPERVLYWEHEGNSAVRRGRWKLVRKFPGGWELYDMNNDRTELIDRSGANPDIVRELAALYEDWAKRCGVIPRERILARYERLGAET